MPGGAPRKPRERRYTQAEYEAAVQAAKTEQKAHDVKGTQQTRIAADAIADKIAASLAPHLAKPAETPSWIRVGGPAISMGVGILTILGIIGGVVMAPLISRVSSMEAKAVEISAALGSVAQRTQVVETRIATAATVRDQQYEGLRDRVTAMERADQQQLERANNLGTTIASILPRLEEILRRQERLESRLSMPLPRSQNDEPAVQILPQERGI